MALIRYVLRNKPESLADMRQPVLVAFTKFLDLLGMVQVGHMFCDWESPDMCMVLCTC